MAWPPWRTVWQFVPKANIYLTLEPEILLLGFYLREIKVYKYKHTIHAHTHTHTYKYMHTHTHREIYKVMVSLFIVCSKLGKTQMAINRQWKIKSI